MIKRPKLLQKAWFMYNNKPEYGIVIRVNILISEDDYTCTAKVKTESNSYNVDYTKLFKSRKKLQEFLFPKIKEEK